MTDDEKLAELETLFRNAALGLGSEDPYSYMARGVSAGHCLEAADAIHTLRQRNARLVEGLRPFSCLQYEEPIVDEEGWTPFGIAWCKDRIVDWFGPSDFRRARTLIEDNSNG